jgi:putative endonuclease
MACCAGWSDGAAGAAEVVLLSSFPDALKAQTRNLEIVFNERARWPGWSYFIYLLASRKDGAFYLGVTNDLIRRVYEHKTKAVPGFTSKYNIDTLVWYEVYDDPVNAIIREKEIKKWRRSWKIQLIERANPTWDDLYRGLAG